MFWQKLASRCFEMKSWLKKMEFLNLNMVSLWDPNYWNPGYYHHQSKSCDFGTCMMSLNGFQTPRVIRKMRFRLDAMVQCIPHFLVLLESSEALPTLNITLYQLLCTSWNRVFTWVASISSYIILYLQYSKWIRELIQPSTADGQGGRMQSEQMNAEVLCKLDTA